MRDAMQAYGKVAKEIASPRELEADLLLKAAARLQAIHDAWDEKRSDLDAALLYNRKLWTVFLNAVTKDDHPLPPEIRQNVANLGIFVMKQTMTTIMEPKPEHLTALVHINRELAAGLRGAA